MEARSQMLNKFEGQWPKLKFGARNYKPQTNQKLEIRNQKQEIRNHTLEDRNQILKVKV